MARKKFTTAEYIERARKVHGDRYDYSQTEFSGWDNHITIICKEHGAYRQSAYSHYIGRNCPICAGKRSTQEIFIAKSKEIHKNKYDYSKVEYVNGATKVCIICPIHGEFWQTPNSHLNGHGCYQCGRDATGAKASLSDLNSFIRRARAVHGDKYDYSLVDLKNHTTKVCIVCPKHGLFYQQPVHHIAGQGCYKCGHDVHRCLIAGVGINDLENDRANTPAYDIWNAMIQRCYSAKHHQKRLTYIDCVVCDEWQRYSNFKKWFEDPENGYREGYHIDKDILIKGNKTYSPETCCFVPAQINDIFVSKKPKKDGLPIGVHTRKGRRGYYASCGQYGKTVHLGVFSTIEAAHSAYIVAKNAYIKEIAETYYADGKITERVYNALMNREF